MIKFNELKGFQGYHTLLHTIMLSEVGEKRNGVKINAMVGMCILALPWGMRLACGGMCGYEEGKYQELLAQALHCGMELTLTPKAN